ncbi:MAG TPA: hypothetical protein VGN42_18800 [Pirellulales bacterium]|jgi:hypothetical protein|nr:hypothetical protein [Pirellulales bacterium]
MSKFFAMAAVVVALGWTAPQSASAGCDCCNAPAGASAQSASPAPAATAQAPSNRRYSYSPSTGVSSGAYRPMSRPSSRRNQNVWRADRKIMGL